MTPCLMTPWGVIPVIIHARVNALILFDPLEPDEQLTTTWLIGITLIKKVRPGTGSSVSLLAHTGSPFSQWVNTRWWDRQARWQEPGRCGPIEASGRRAYRRRSANRRGASVTALWGLVESGVKGETWPKDDLVVWLQVETLSNSYTKPCCKRVNVTSVPS